MDKHPSVSRAESPAVHTVQEMEATIVPQQPNASASCEAYATGAATDDGALTSSSDLEDSSPFSIRGYVAAVREIDIARCWPFSQKLLEESIQARKDPLLPPLTPFTCNVRIQREYYHAGSHTYTDAICDANSGPQLQVQIDVSKCEPGGGAASRPEDPPNECEFASHTTQEACSPHKKLAHQHDSPFPDGDLVFKRQAPRSIREIRKSVMQGCQCFKRNENAICTKDTCSYSQNIACLDGGDAVMVDNLSGANFTDAMGDLQKKHVASNENTSVITELECYRKNADRRKGYMGVQASHVDGTPNNADDLHQDAVGTAGQPISPCDMKRSRTVAEMTLLTSDVPSHANPECRTHADCSLDSQSAGKSIESQNSKSLSSRACLDTASMQQHAFETMPGLDNIPQQKCPVCLLFQSSSNTALNAHIDHCLVASSAEAMDKGNSKLQRGKVRKKRSMAELCQVAPPCSSSSQLIAFPGSSSVASQRVKDSTATESLKKKRTKLQPQAGLENATIDISQSDSNRKLIKSQAQALQFLQWRSRSVSSPRELQMSHGTSRRSVLQEARLANFSKSRLRTRKLEMKACSALRKRHWKSRKVNHQPAAVSKHPAHKLKKIMQTEKKKCTREHQNDVRQFQGILPQTDILKASKDFDSRVLHKDKSAASNSILPQKRRPSKQTAHVETLDTVVTVKGSHKTTLEILRPNNPANEELNQTKKIHFKVHVKPAKKRNKQRTTVDVPQTVQNRESINEDPNDSHNQALFRNVGKTIQAAGSAQAELVKDSNSSVNNLRRIAESLTPGPCLPLLSSVMRIPQAEVRMPPMTALLHSDIPSTNNAGKSRTEGTTRCFADIDDMPLLSHDHQAKGLRNSDGCAAQAQHSPVTETRQNHMTDSQQARASHLLSSIWPHCSGASMQKCREFPFALCPDDVYQWRRDPGKKRFLMTSSDHATCRPTYQFRPEQVAKLAQMLAASNRNREFAAGQGTARPRTVMSEGIQFSIQPEKSTATHQLNLGSHVHSNQLTTQNAGGSQLETWQAQSSQRLPAWMQAAIHEQRSSTMSSVDVPTNSVGRSIMLNTTPCVSRETSRASPTLDMIGNPVLRLMGKTMVLMPESHQNQVDHTTTHFNGSSNYINFFQLSDTGEALHKRQWNVDHNYNAGAQEGIVCQDYRSTNHVQSRINSSTPQLQDFFVQMPSSSPTGKSPFAHQQTIPHADGRNMPAQDGNSQWLHVGSSSMPSGVLQSTHTNWPSQKAPSTTFFQPQSSLFCQHNRMVSCPLFSEKEVFPWIQKDSCTHRTKNPVQNLANLSPQSSAFPCLLPNINRADQPATVIVLDEEGPCTTDKSTPGDLEEELMLGCQSANQQTRLAQTKASISDTCHSMRENQKGKTFIPIIYTVGTNLRDSCSTLRTMGPKFQKLFTADAERRDMDQCSRALGGSRKNISSVGQVAGKRTMISAYTGVESSPADVIRVGANSHSIAEVPQFGCALKHMQLAGASQAATERMKSLPTRGPSSALKTLVSQKPSNALQQDANGAEASPPPLELQTTRMGMCSVNMNPAEVDCQDTGQFMSTPTLISTFRARPVPIGGQECMDNSRTINASSQSLGSSSSQIRFAVDKILNSAISTVETTRLGRQRSMVMGSSSAKAPSKENNNASVIFNFSKTTSAREDVSTRGVAAANPLADSRTDDADMLQEFSSSRMQALKVAGKFKIMNGRVSIVRKELPTNVADRAASDK